MSHLCIGRLFERVLVLDAREILFESSEMYVYLTQILGVASPCCYLFGKGVFFLYFCYEKEVGFLTHDDIECISSKMSHIS